MKVTIQTRIFLALTVDEARVAVTQPTDMQLAIRSTLFEIDGIPVSEMMARSKPALIAAPKKDGHKKPKSKRTNRMHAPHKECPYCHEMKHPTGYYRHVKACQVKHPDAPVEEESPDIPYGVGRF